VTNVLLLPFQCYTLLVAVEADRQAWLEALKPRLKRSKINS